MSTREELSLLKLLFMRGSHFIRLMKLFIILMTILIFLNINQFRLERDVDDHWHDLSKALESFAKNDSEEVLPIIFYSYHNVS